MRDSVRDAFFDFSTKFEGAVNFMYLDVKGLVTTGIGNLIDPEQTAVGLPWQVLGIRDASPSEIREAWQAVKARQDLRLHGGMAFKNITSLRLSQAAIVDLVNGRIATDETELRDFFPQWDDFPADAQLGIMSMAWAVGAAFAQKFPAFKRAANSGDWVTAAAESHISDGAPARNDANHYLFCAAACTVKDGTDPEVLHWPMPRSAA